MLLTWRQKNKMDKIRTTSKVTGERIKKYLEEGKRFDGRTPEEFRELTIEKNVSVKAEGSVRVKLGKTEVIVGVKMAPSEPYADSPDKGNLMVTAEMLPLSSPRFESGPPKIEAIEWARVTDRGLRESGFVDFEKLCIKEGEKVLIVEDVVTTGGSVKEVIELMEEKKADIIGISSIIDRSSGNADFKYQFKPLLRVDIKSYKANECELCRKGIPVTRPGSRT